MALAEPMSERQTDRLSAATLGAFARCIDTRLTQPHIVSARSIRNALDRARLRQALRPFERRDRSLMPEDLMTTDTAEILASHVPTGGPAVDAEPPR